MNAEQKISFLRTVTMFEDLTSDELADLVHIVTAYTFKPGAIIAYQRDVADKLYIVQQGRLEEYFVNEAGEVVEKYPYLPGSAFRDVWLISPTTHPGTIRAVRAGTLLTIKSSDFLAWLSRHPNATLDMSEEAWRMVEDIPALAGTQHYRRFELLPGEKVIFGTRRSRWVLVGKILIPLLLILTIAAFFIWLSLGLSLWIELVLVFIFVIGPLLWAGYSLFDWFNDYILLTNKFVLHREYDLFQFQGHIDKVPLEQVQSVNAVKNSVVQSILHIGDIRITTAAQATALFFNNVGRPTELQEKISAAAQDARRAGRALGQARSQQVIRESVESYYQLPPQLERDAPEEDGSKSAESAQQTRPSWFRRRYGYRVVEGDIITFRRHWIVFVRHAIWPLIALGGWILIVSTIGIFSGPTMTNPVFALIALSFLALILFGLYWYFENWRNDIYRLTSNMVIDLAKLPLGFGSSRTEAALSNVQNVTALQPNLLSTLLRYGEVTVETAGASANIVFLDVARPNQVQADIFQRIQRVRNDQSQRQEEQRRREFITMMDVFRQLEEQRNLPGRTPRPDEHIDDSYDEDVQWYSS